MQENQSDCNGVNLVSICISEINSFFSAKGDDKETIKNSTENNDKLIPGLDNCELHFDALT